MLIDPDAPAKVLFIGPWKAIGADNLSAKFEVTKPAIRKGIIREYVLSGTCFDRHAGGSAIALPVMKFAVDDEKRDNNRLDVPSLPSYSTCTISVAAATSIGTGNNAYCTIQPPLVCKIILDFHIRIEDLTMFKSL